MMKERIMIVDDEEDMLEGLKRMLHYEMPEVNVYTFSNPLGALQFVKEKPVDVALIDIRMPEMDGLELLEHLRKIDPWLTIIMITAYGTIEIAVEAIKRGAYDFVTKPFEKDALLRTLKKGRERNSLIRENMNLRQRVNEKSAFQNFVGQSLQMKKLYESIQTIALTDYTVLIRGESGTGKELAARAIHSLSKRRNRPLVIVNCPAIPEHLLESELFGHKKGAFTGANSDHVGLFEEAHKSTILLDEIGDIPVTVQTKLLRVLQDQEFKPLGARTTIKVDVRIMASTNQNLEQKIRNGSFREDLFYRLNVLTLKTPSLREIREDIPLIVNHFARKTCNELEISYKRFSIEALKILMNREWPGNVRELENFVKRTVMFCPDDVIRPEDIAAMDDNADTSIFNMMKQESEGIIEPYKKAKDRVVNRFTFKYVSELLEKTGGNVTKAAELSGLGRTSLQKIMRRLGIKSEHYREGVR